MKQGPVICFQDSLFVSDDYVNVPRVSRHGLPDCGNDWVEFIESLCKIEGLSVDYLVLLGFFFFT